MKPIILTFVNSYLPGYKSGGPIRTIANLVNQLGDEFGIRIITSDRDAHDDNPFAGIDVDQWTQVGRAQVYYCSPQNRTFKSFRRLINDTPHDLLYLNSFFNATYTLKPVLLRWMRLIPQKPLLIAPRGEFSPGALAIKSAKKSVFMSIARIMGLYEPAYWQASNDMEAAYLRSALPHVRQPVYIAPNMPPRQGQTVQQASDTGPTGTTRILFLSRISPKKNLDFALTVLSKVASPVDFSIYGPIDDANYWERCKSVIKTLPSNISVEYHGPVRNELVPDIMSNHDLFFLPTRGENYGHVIPEALSAGTPVLIANTTPWTNLTDAGVGWDLPLADESSFVSHIEAFANMGRDEQRRMGENAVAYAHSRLTDPVTIAANRQMFLELLRTY